MLFWIMCLVVLWVVMVVLGFLLVGVWVMKLLGILVKFLMVSLMVMLVLDLNCLVILCKMGLWLELVYIKIELVVLVVEEFLFDDEDVDVEGELLLLYVDRMLMVVILRFLRSIE